MDLDLWSKIAQRIEKGHIGPKNGSIYVQFARRSKSIHNMIKDRTPLITFLNQAILPTIGHQALYASMMKLCYHPDLSSLNRFDRLILAFSRWSHFLLFNLVQLKDSKISSPWIMTHLEEWRSLNLDPAETRLVEVLVLCGKGPLFKCPVILATRLKFMGDLTQLSLAKYEMVNHPRDPMRLTKISSLLTTMESLASTPSMVSLLFQGNIGAVTQIINGIFLFQ